MSFAATPLAEIRLTPAEVDAIQAHEQGSGTSGVAGIRTTVLLGDPAQPGRYTIRLSVPYISGSGPTDTVYVNGGSAQHEHRP